MTATTATQNSNLMGFLLILSRGTTVTPMAAIVYSDMALLKLWFNNTMHHLIDVVDLT